MAQHLVAGCPHIDTLDLSFCGAAVTDEILGILVKGLRNLTRLGIRGCLQVTDVGVESLMEHGKSLKSVNITQCSNISKPVVATAAQIWEISLQSMLDPELVMPVKVSQALKNRAATAPTPTGKY